MRVEFHTDVADPVSFACRLLRKVFRSGARAAVLAPDPTLAQLDQALWTNDALDFVPHLRWRGALDNQRLARTPIWLSSGGPSPPDCAIGINVGLDDLSAFEPYARVIEIVSRDAADVLAARARWRTHRERGVDVEHHPHRDPE